MLRRWSTRTQKRPGAGGRGGVSTEQQHLQLLLWSAVRNICVHATARHALWAAPMPDSVQIMSMEVVQCKY